MTFALALATFLGVLAWIIARTLLIDEIKGRLQQRSKATLEEGIQSLPEELREAWAEKWLKGFAAVASMPISAARYALAVCKLPKTIEGAREMVERAIALLSPGAQEE